MISGRFVALAAFMCLLALPGPSMAAGRCYSLDEIDAENVLRLHSELMVITVTCHQGSHGEDLVKAYTGFTQNNIDRIRDAEQTMVAYYKGAYGGKGVDKLDKLRTQLANEYGQQIANVSAPQFCAEKRDKVLVLYGASPEAVSGEFLQVSGRSYDPPCGGRGQMARKNK